MGKKTFTDESLATFVNEIRNYTDTGLDTKLDIPNVITTATTSLALVDNTEYRLSNVSQLTLSYPTGSFEVWMNIRCASTGTVSITLPSTTKYLGAAPTFGNGQNWEISIKDGVAICWRIS